MINVEDEVGKTVGKRTRSPKHPLVYANGLQKSARKIKSALGHKGLPKGVFRFKTHEEADQWLMEKTVQALKKS